MPETNRSVDMALEFRDVFFRVDQRVIFQDLSFSLRKGESLYILGGSGSGKSLLLKICAGLLIPEMGKVILGGIDLAEASKELIQELRTKIGFVFQNSALISNMALYDNIALPLRYHHKWSEAEVRLRVEEKMALFSVDRSFDRSIPSLLSLEMHKRAALARAFVLNPELLLLDQPTGGLESETARELGKIIRDYQQKTKASLLEVSSEWPPPEPYANRVGVLEGGRIVAEGTVEDVKSYLEKAN
jgi:phospholipid/cholesterol/gamma-HCH transport system ATP-binding protein